MINLIEKTQRQLIMYVNRKAEKKYWLRVSRGGSDRCRCRLYVLREKTVINISWFVENPLLKCHLSAHFMTVATNKMCIRFGACGLVLCVHARLKAVKKVVTTKLIKYEFHVLHFYTLV